MTKEEALAKFLKCKKEDILEIDGWNCIYSKFDSDDHYRVCTEKEADEISENLVKESIWNALPNEILPYLRPQLNGLEDEEIEHLSKTIIILQGKLGKHFLPILKTLLTKSFDDFVEEYIRNHSRAEFLAPSDHKEEKIAYYFIYKSN